MIFFVNGLNRSGTTVMQEAVAAATGGTPLTVGDLIRHGSPAMATRLREIVDSPEPVDRGVDHRPVTEDLPEEYGWILLDQPGQWTSPQFRPALTAKLRQVTDAIAERARPVVMKNPHDFGHENVLLLSFPESKMILVRRNLPALIDSTYRASARLVTSRRYLLTLANDVWWARFLLWTHERRSSTAAMRFLTRWTLRMEVVLRMRAMTRLPLDRVAYLDYDEMTADPSHGARWASHLLDATRLATEFRIAHSIPVSPEPPAAPWIDRRIDRTWAAVWTRMRFEQVRRGVIDAADTDARA